MLLQMSFVGNAFLCWINGKLVVLQTSGTPAFPSAGEPAVLTIEANNAIGGNTNAAQVLIHQIYEDQG